MAEGFSRVHYVKHDFDDHTEDLNEKLHSIEGQRDVLTRQLQRYQQNLSQHPLLKQVDQWEQDALERVRKTAKEARIAIVEELDKSLQKNETKLSQLTKQIQQTRGEHDYHEIQIINLQTRLQKLHEEMNRPSQIQIREDATLVQKLHADIASPKLFHRVTFDLPYNQEATTVAGGHGKGSNFNQISFPSGIDIDDDQTMYISDMANHRVVEWRDGATTGKVVAGGNEKGDRNDQLNRPAAVIIDRHHDALIIADNMNRRVVRWPRRNGRSGETIISNVKCVGLAMNKSGDIYVVDDEKNEVRKWKIGAKEGTLVAGGNGRGTDLNQLNTPSYIFVDDHESVYISDYRNHRVVKWPKGAEEGIVIAGGQGEGSGLKQLNYPGGLFVDSAETVYIVDCDNHQVVRRLKGAKDNTVVIGIRGQGSQSSQLFNPINLYVDRQGSIFVVDLGNSRVQKFCMLKNE